MKQQSEGKTEPHSKKEEEKKKVGKGLGCGGWDLSRSEVWAVGGANA